MKVLLVLTVLFDIQKFSRSLSWFVSKVCVMEKFLWVLTCPLLYVKVLWILVLFYFPKCWSLKCYNSLNLSSLVLQNSMDIYPLWYLKVYTMKMQIRIWTGRENTSPLRGRRDLSSTRIKTLAGRESVSYLMSRRYVSFSIILIWEIEHEIPNEQKISELLNDKNWEERAWAPLRAKEMWAPRQ